MMDATTTRDLATRSRVGAAGRLQLDALAHNGGKGELRWSTPGRFTLSVRRPPTGGWTPLHKVTGETLRNLARLGLVELWTPDDPLGVGTVELTDAGRRVAELAA